MQYNEFITQINTGKIKKAMFYLDGYAHYKNCCIETKRMNPQLQSSLLSISVNLTTDGYEKHGFIEKFKEDFKLFDLKSKGRFTLKQLWSFIVITDIVMADGDK